MGSSPKKESWRPSKQGNIAINLVMSNTSTSCTDFMVKIRHFQCKTSMFSVHNKKCTTNGTSYTTTSYNGKNHWEHLPARVKGPLEFQCYLDLFSEHSCSILLPPYILCLIDKGDHKHASKHDFWDHSASRCKFKHIV